MIEKSPNTRVLPGLPVDGSHDAGNAIKVDGSKGNRGSRQAK